MVIHVKDHVASCDTNEQGDVVFSLISEELHRTGSVTVDFQGVLYTTSSFVNSAFVPLLDSRPFEDIKGRLRIVKVNSQIGDMIRKRMSFEASRLAA